MSYSVTWTKVILPRRLKGLVSRHRLLNLLDDLLEYRLTLVAAPAGYGKTTLLVDLASTVEYPVCWLALDPLDTDLLRFLIHFVAAIRQKFPEFGGASISLINNHDGGHFDQEQFLRSLVNDLYEQVSEHFALVLDDFHLVDSSPEINHFINRFAQEMDDNCHLVIASRSLLSLPDLPLMIGRSQVKGLSFEELAFQPEEIQSLFYTKYQQELDIKQAESIGRDTEGWITGLLLTAETTQPGLTDTGRAARAAGVDLYDYLAQQVLDQQSEEMQEFLLRSSLLDEFNAELCQQALGEAPGDLSWSDLIGRLLQKNLFIQPVESGGTWLRYHHLFGDFLQHHFITHFPGQARKLRLKLVDLYAERRWWEKAYDSCLKLDSEKITADFISASSADMVHSGKISLLASWLDKLSPQLVNSSPQLLGTRGALACMLGDPEGGLEKLNRSLELQAAAQDGQLYAKTLIRRTTCHRFLGNNQEGLKDARQALKLTGDTNTGSLLAAEAEREIGLILRRLGQSKSARDHLKRSLAAYRDLRDQKNAAFVIMDLGLVDMNAGFYQAASQLFQESYASWEKEGNLNQLVGVCNNLGVLDHLTGAYLGAFQWFSKGLHFGRQASNLRGTAFLLSSLAELAVDLGAYSRAESYLEESRKLAEETGDSYLQIYLQLLFAGLVFHQGDQDEAAVWLTGLQAELENLPAADASGKWHYHNGLISLAGDQFDQARQHMEKALQLYQSLTMPVESALCSIYLARLDSLADDREAAVQWLERAQALIDTTSTIQPLVPALSRQWDFLCPLAESFPENHFLDKLAAAVMEFQSNLPLLMEQIKFNQLPQDRSRSAALEITALGRVSVKRQGSVISVPEWIKQRTVRELFFYLLSQPEGASREEICLVFWPESKPEQLKKQFKNALYRLRRAVGRDTILYHSPTRLYYFNRRLEYYYDVEQFQLAIQGAEEELDPDKKIQGLRRAAALYRHPFAPSLEGIWSEPFRYRLYRAYEKCVLELADLQRTRGAVGAALESIEDLLDIVPSQEAAWRSAMRCYATRGDRSGIERTFQRCRKALIQDLNTEPSEETRSLYQQLMA